MKAMEHAQVWLKVSEALGERIDTIDNDAMKASMFALVELAMAVATAYRRAK